MKSGKQWILFFLMACTVNSVSAQHPPLKPIQQLRGVVTDHILQKPLPGVTVKLLPENRTVVTDESGGFRFPDVPLGTHQLQLTSVGFREVLLENIAVNAGKETVLSISMQTSVRSVDTVTVTAKSRRNKAINEFSTVSARAFTVEETQKYAAAVNDPLRMATAFPGVVAPDDGNNSIVIRGNSPAGLLWRMEGIDIPNPNHFSSAGSSGGGISILSAQLLSNSDFITGAFAAEYGNALSGVFDLRLRKGNNEKREYTFEAGVLGLNAAVEGPVAPFYKGSYLVNYRYSTLSLLDKIGIPLGSSTIFQDLSYNVYLPTKKLGTFSLFGFGGLSSQDDRAERDSLQWKDRFDRYDSRYVSNTGVAGMTHTLFSGANTTIRTALAYSYNRLSGNYDYLKDDYNIREDHRDSYRTKKLTLTSSVNQKLSAKHTLRSGIILSQTQFNYYKRTREHNNSPLEEVINSDDKTYTLQAFSQWQFRPVEQVTVNAGLHYLRLFYNNSEAIEPRASARWQADRKNSIAFGYGLHSQVQPMGVYFAKVNSNGGSLNPNRDLGFSKAHHYVFSFQHAFNRYLSVKAEAYYQALRNVPISTSDTSTLSLLNIENDYITDPLVNKGKGRNYGIELSLEKYLHKQFYYTITTSVYESKYTAADGIERNTRFNGNYVSTLVAGKEFIHRNKQRTFGINFKGVYAGGLRTTPIDRDRSAMEGHAVYREFDAFTLQNAPYFRSDIRISMKWNRKRLTSTLSLDIQNFTNRKNVYGQWYDDEKNEIRTSHLNGLIPVLNYKVEF